MLNATPNQRRSTLTRTWVKVVDTHGRQRMEARWTTATEAVARPLAA